MRGTVIAPNWLGRVRLAATFGLVGSDVPTVALAGFLVRGGLFLLLLPGVVLPSVLGIAGATGRSGSRAGSEAGRVPSNQGSSFQSGTGGSPAPEGTNDDLSTSS